MSGPESDERRLHPRDAVPHVDYYTTSDSTASRCWICGRPLHAKVSVRLGIGPKCWSDRMGAA